MRRGSRHRQLAGLRLALLTTALASLVQAEDTARLQGRLRVSVSGLSLADAGATVVFLEAEGETRVSQDPPRTRAVVRQSGARFEPEFLAVARGQVVEMPNDDVIFHNVFSYSEPNDFDLGMYAAGETRSVRLDHSGLVRIYCSIHEEMDGLIFVAPSRLFAVPGATGDWSIVDVPPGRYRLRVWSERLPEIVESVVVADPSPMTVDLAFDEPAR